jgi:predicted transcriptional regulator
MSFGNTNLIFGSLVELGISEFESQIYLQVLDNPSSSVSSLADTNKCSRTKIYKSLNVLQKNCLIIEGSNYKRKIQIEEPSKILMMLRNKQNLINQNINNLSDLIPKLSTKKNNSQIFDSYSGVQEFTSLLNKVLDESKGEILFWGNMNGFYELLGWDYLDQFGYYRRQKKIPLRMLVYKTFGTTKFLLKDKSELRETRFLDDKYYSNGVVWFYNNKTIHWNLVQLKAIEIDDAVINEFLKVMFEDKWGG